MLGKLLVHAAADAKRHVGRIVETEGYVGPGDAASHARAGPSGRARVMFGPAGFAYVFVIYGVYHCFNAVTEDAGFPSAVLVRAVETQGDAAGERGNGPGLLCRSLRIDRACNGLDLTSRDATLFVEDAPVVADADVRVGPRIGVDYAGEWASRPWRFWVTGSPHVSRVRLATGVPYVPGVH